jgi:quinoprotein glucose dehydrogenase
VAIDPKRGLLITNSTNAAYQVRLFDAKDFPKEQAADPTGEVRPQDGTPYGMTRSFFTERLPAKPVTILQIPCHPSPWGYLNAIDLRTGTVKWRETLGKIGFDFLFFLKAKRGLPSLGGAIMTSTGLAFIAGTIGDDHIRAFDVDTHKEMWKGSLPAGGQATPITYTAQWKGHAHQFVVIAAGGNGRATSRLGDSLVAFSLPE